MSVRTRRTRRRQEGFVGILVAVGIFALAGAAALSSVMINNGRNQRTLDILTDPEATSAELDTISNQDLRNLNNNLADNAGLLTGFSSLGTAALPSGSNGAEVAANALEDQIRNIAAPAVVNYMSDPESSWNRDDEGDRPSEGTTATGGVAPDDVIGGTGDVRFTLVWNADVDLDLHAVDPCGAELYFAEDMATCEGNTGELDVDDVSGGAGSTENIFWPEGGAPTGPYEYWVLCFSGCDEEPATYTISRTVNGRRMSSTGTLSADDEESPRQMFTFTR